MIESAVTDLPQPDSPTTPSVPPCGDLEVDPVDRAQKPSRVSNPVGGSRRRAAARSSSLSASLSAPGAVRARHGTIDVLLERRQHDCGIARLEGVEQLAMLLDVPSKLRKRS